MKMQQRKIVSNKNAFRTKQFRSKIVFRAKYFRTKMTDPIMFLTVDNTIMAHPHTTMFDKNRRELFCLIRLQHILLSFEFKIFKNVF
jgi:hypothetical protein